MTVTSRRTGRAEASITREAELLDGLTNAILWEADPASFRISFVSDSVEAVLGYPKARWLEPDFWLSHIHADDREATARLCATATADGREHDLEYRTLAADGRTVWIRNHVVVLPDSEGRPRALRGLMTDITAHKRVEDELRESEKRLRFAMDAAGQGHWEWNIQTGHVSWSETLELIHGIPPGSFAGSFEAYLADVFPEDRDTLVRQIRESVETGTHDVEYRIARPDGAIRWVSGKGSAVYDRDGVPISMIGVCQDITERKRAEQRLQFLVEAAALFATSLDFDTVLERVAELIVGNMADWCAIDLIDNDGVVTRPLVTHADPSKAEIAERLKKFVPNPASARNVADVLRRGTSILEPQLSDSQLAGAAVDDEHLQIMRDLGFKSALIVPLLTRERLLGAITFVSAESGRRYSVEDLNLAEDIALRAALAIDNARLYREAQEVQEQLRAANEAKDEFLGLVSHELRTPITTIYGGARVLRSRRDKLTEENRLEILEDIEHETERLYRLVEDLLVLARLELGQEIELEPVLIQRVIEKIAKSVEPRMTGHHLELELTEGGPALGDATYLEQVLRNLVSNAEKYSPAGTAITICARAADDEAVVTVLDRGPGISDDEADSIFERFYRSRAAAGRTRGLGLGLTVCKRLIEAQGGRIWARPRAEGGLEVGFAIPLYQEEAPWAPNH